MSGVLKPGARFAGRYMIEALIAEGGMASIYRAQDEQSGRHVAIKVLYPYYSDNEIIRQRFVEEGNIQAALGHPNVVHVHDIVLEPLAIVMEHVNGPTLDELLAEKGFVEENEILDLIIPVMSALGLAHSKGIIHRDLKPSNILLNRLARGYQPKVMDFGVAKVKDAKHNLTATGTTVGTLHYMSPEQIVGSKSIDGRADIYSIGVTMFKLATGEVPFNAPTEFALMMAQVEAPPTPPSHIRPEVTPELERVILKAMEKKPVDRFQTVREFTTALLEMKRGKDRTVRDTVTETISQELLEFALAANEVAKDRTAEMSLDMIRATLGEAATNYEATVEMDATMRLPDSAVNIPSLQTQESTLELTSSDILRMSTMDGDLTSRDDDNGGMETEVLDRRIDAPPDRRSTRPSRPVQGLPGTDSSLVSESIETNSMSRRVAIESGQVVVLDHDADSRDMTAPSMREPEFKNPPLPLPRPSGPKVVLGYNPADTQDRTFEKPNYRTRLPKFETSKSDDNFENPFKNMRPGSGPRRPMPNGGDRRSGPRRPPPPPSSSSSSSLLERIDIAAQSALQVADEHNLPRSLVIAAGLSVFVIIGCVIFLVGTWALG